MDVRETVYRAIFKAGGLITEAFEREGSSLYQEKDRNDFVTETDKNSEKIIKDILSDSFPDIPFLAEESAQPISAETFWIIDPLDGTTNFIHRYPSVGVSVALLSGGEVVFGMVLDPMRKELFEAELGRGAFCNGKPVGVSEVRDFEHALIGTGFPFSLHDYLENYLEIFKKIFGKTSGVRRAGAATLDLCHVACGRLDGFWELHLKPWDMAAGALIVKEAGGKVSDFFGGTDFLNSGNIAAGNRFIYPHIIKITSESLKPADLEQVANNLIV